MTQLMQGKRGLIMGVANDHSIAWGIARTLAAQGATLAFTYQGEALGRRVTPLAQSVGASLLLPSPGIFNSEFCVEYLNRGMDINGAVY